MGNKAGSAKKTESAKTKKPPAVKKTKVPAAVRPKPVSKPAKKAAVSKKNSAPALSSGEVAQRAYYISEKRIRLGIPGDSTQDWLEAERQLISELKSKKTS